MVYSIPMGKKPVLPAGRQAFKNEDRWLDLLLTLLLLPPFILKKIGDTVIYFFQKIYAFISFLLINLLNKLEKFIIRLKIYLSRPKLPEEKIIFKKRYLPVKLPRFSLPSKPVIILPVSFVKFEFFVLGIVACIIFIFIPYNVYEFLKELPSPDHLSLREIPVTTKIYDRNGILLYEIYTDQNRTPLTLKEVPDLLKKATIAIEDKEFYQHQGISLKAITRALYFNLNSEAQNDGRLQGGSTKTQQLIKSALLTPERTITRKVKEIILAFWAERLYSKDEIL